MSEWLKDSSAGRIASRPNLAAMAPEAKAAMAERVAAHRAWQDAYHAAGIAAADAAGHIMGHPERLRTRTAAEKAYIALNPNPLDAKEGL